MIVLFGTLMLACPAYCHMDRFGDGTEFILVDTERAWFVCTVRDRKCWRWLREELP